MKSFLKIDAWDLAAGESTAVYIADTGHMTTPDDTPGNAYFEGRLTLPPSFEITMFKDGVTGGKSDGGFGEIEAANPDGGLDALAGYAFDGRAWTFRRGDRFDTATTVASGVIESVEISWDTVRFNIRDRSAELETPIQTNLYAGDNSGPTGVEGTEDDLKDKEKPLAFGYCLNVPCVCVNSSTLIYQVHDGQIHAVGAVYDKGAALTATADYTDLAALQAATFTAGHYATCLALGLIRLWVTPAGDVTADIEGDAAGGVYVSTAGAIVSRILTTRTGYTTADFSAADLATLDAANPAPVGLFIEAGDSTDIDEAIDTLLRSVGAAWGPDSTGFFRFQRLEAPAGTPVKTLTGTEVLDNDNLARLPAHDVAGGVPYWRVRVKYARNWTKQNASSLAGVVTDARRAWLAEEWRTVSVEDALVLTAHPFAPTLEVETYLTDAAAALAEAARLLALHGAERARYTVPLDPSEAMGIEIGDVVELDLDRFVSPGGQLFVVVGISRDGETDTDSEAVELTLYG